MSKFKQKIKKHFVEICTVAVGLTYSLITYICALDGVYEKLLGRPITYYEATEPEAFWRVIQVNMVLGGIIAVSGVLFSYLQNQK